MALRQHWYPLEDKPSDEQLQQLVLYDMGKINPELLKKVIQAWSKVHKKGAEFGRKNDVTREPYTQWVLEMVQIVKLTFVADPTYTEDVSDPLPMFVEEIENLNKDLDQAQKEKEGLEHSLHNLTRERR